MFPHPVTPCKAERRPTTRRAARTTRAHNSAHHSGPAQGPAPSQLPRPLLPSTRPEAPPRPSPTPPTPHPASSSAAGGARGCGAPQPSWPGPAGSGPARPGWPCRLPQPAPSSAAPPEVTPPRTAGSASSKLLPWQRWWHFRVVAALRAYPQRPPPHTHQIPSGSGLQRPTWSLGGWDTGGHR